MKGYFKNEKKTAEVLQDGWFNTGDMGKKTYNGKYLKIIGRIKDTIVLRGGENVEPQPLEDKLGESPYINMVIVVGQDKPRLGALIVPDFEALTEFARAKISLIKINMTWLKRKKFYLYRAKRLLSKDNGFQPWNSNGYYSIADFSRKDYNESLKLKRFIIHEKYAKEID